MSALGSPRPTDGGDVERRSAASVVGSALLSVGVAASLLLGGPLPVEAKSKMTPDERLSVDIFKKASPSVVNVTNLRSGRTPFTMDPTEFPQGSGSGFIWDAEGRIVTNFHVITDANDIKVSFSSEDSSDQYPARVVGVDPDKDIAVLQIALPQEERRARLKPLPVCGTASDLEVGMKVFAIGNPFGLDHTLTTGVVSGIGREIQSISGRPIQDVIQTDAAINPGNSGGPLIDTGGCVIGINTAIYSSSGTNSGVGFAIPADVVRSSVNQIIATGRVMRPALGISFAPDPAAETLGVKGILVLNIREGGPAWKAGLRGTTRDDYGRLVLGDIITGINGNRIRNSSDLYRTLDRSQVGDTLEVKLLRATSEDSVRLTLEPNPNMFYPGYGAPGATPYGLPPYGPPPGAPPGIPGQPGPVPPPGMPGVPDLGVPKQPAPGLPLLVPQQ